MQASGACIPSASNAWTGGRPSAGLGTLFGEMWIFLALGLGIVFCVVLVLNLVAVAFASVLARQAEPRDELGPELRARLVTYGR